MVFPLQGLSSWKITGEELWGNPRSHSQVMAALEAVVLPWAHAELRLKYGFRLHMVLRHHNSVRNNMSPTLAIWALELCEAFCRRRDAALESPSDLCLVIIDWLSTSQMNVCSFSWFLKATYVSVELSAFSEGRLKGSLFLQATYLALRD